MFVAITIFTEVENMNPNNPLKQYFRQPAIYIKLPSQGKNYPPGALIMPATGELPVYPMTAIDEITYRTPDALYNGQATVNVIQSCVPDIKDAWSIPATDVDTLLIAIRIATYGHNMDFDTTCPACGHDSEQSIDLRTVLDSISLADYNKTISAGDMEIFFKPLNYQHLNNNNQMQYENQKLLQMLPDSAVPDTEKMTALTDALKKITDITVTALSQSIAAIKTPQATVYEPEYLEEMLKNCDSRLFNQIRDFVLELKASSEMKPLKIACPECKNEYEQSITLDMASFFEYAS
jgi:T4 bacteriophage base plate protein